MVLGDKTNKIQCFTGRDGAHKRWCLYVILHTFPCLIQILSKLLARVATKRVAELNNSRLKWWKLVHEILWKPENCTISLALALIVSSATAKCCRWEMNDRISSKNCAVAYFKIVQERVEQEQTWALLTLHEQHGFSAFLYWKNMHYSAILQSSSPSQECQIKTQICCYYTSPALVLLQMRSIQQTHRSATIKLLPQPSLHAALLLWKNTQKREREERESGLKWRVASHSSWGKRTTVQQDISGPVLFSVLLWCWRIPWGQRPKTG